jgi:SPP1 gp7 family putative phage head morphogenesis protein
MSADGRLLDQFTRRQIFNQRFAASLTRKSLPYLAEMRREIGLALLAANLSGEDAASLATALAAVEVATIAVTDRMLIAIMPDLLAFADAESAFARKALAGATDARVDNAKRSVVAKGVRTEKLELISGKKVTKSTIPQMFRLFANGISREVSTSVTAGIISKTPTPDIVRLAEALINTRAKAQADTLMRTSANHAGSVARSATYAANKGVVQAEKFVAILDSSTTITCASLDGQIFPIGDGPHPALHWGCRSVRVPLVLQGVALNLPGGGRTAATVKPLDARTTYGGWLKQQPASVQDEVLGDKRAELFRSGKLSIGKFTDDTGKVYTLDRLKELEPLAFE